MRSNSTGRASRQWIRWHSGLLCGALLAIFLAAPGARATSGETRIVAMQSFTRDQGLRSLATNVLLRDRRGVLWVGTDKGLYRYDGREFVPVEDDERAPLRVNDLYQARNGRIWIGAAQGLYVWRDGRVEAVADVPVDDLRRIAGDGAQGVYVRHQHRLVHVGADGRVEPIAWPRALRPGVLTDGPVLWLHDRLWTTCGPQLCTRTADGDQSVWGVAHGVPADQWITFHRDDRGALWVGGMHHLLRLTAGSDRFLVIDSKDPVEVIDNDSQGRVLAGTAGHISRWDGSDWTRFADDRRLQSAQIRDLVFDPSGSVWLATGGRGVLRWRGYGRFQNWLGAQGLDSAPTWAIARDGDGRLWLGNQRHGNLLEPGATRLTPWPSALRRRDWVDAIALLPQGRRMWILFNRGIVVRYDLDTKRAQQVVRNAGWAKFALFDAQGRLWFGTHGSLWRIDDVDAPQPQVRREETGLPEDTRYMGAASATGGGLWFATSRGLLRFRQGRFERMRTVTPMPEGGFADVARTGDGRLWLAPVAGGLYWTHPDRPGALHLHSVNDALLQHSLVYSLAVDRSGQLWVSSADGLDRYDGGDWRRYDRNDGLVWDDMSAHAFHQDRDGSIWFGTSGGVSHLLHPQRRHRVMLRAPSALQVQYGSQRLVPGQSGSWPWSRQALTIALATTSDVHAGAARIEYRLLSGDEEADARAWDTSVSRQLRYAALAPGRYRFQARVADPGLRLLSPTWSFDFVIVPPWWRTGWARAGYVLLALITLLLTWRLRNAQLLRRQRQLERMVADRTAELEADKRELEAARLALQHEASHDALTGLLNRGAVVDILVEALLSMHEDGRPLAVVLFDLDHFKQINDTYGHLTGDAVLVQCAQRLRRLAPDEASLGRYGGEELLAVWPGLSSDGELAPRFATLLEGCYTDGDRQLRATCSIGVAWARHGDDVGTLLRRADAALYRAKRSGRARVERAD
ncbi:diguanylate cyclase [Oleiagrimonas sp. MCCC 1A03011]|uniref:ligand-binding sensor domain-containing diguanylate cyclase n=1 Tax=Oleiagrimonas sp. MCCC 1A03011 TaxID=1926883 RepID=UPI00143D4FBC|nr:diguanylate cyclase [Oleiagrimonas sp. MCCC 1A03011]